MPRLLFYVVLLCCFPRLSGAQDSVYSAAIRAAQMHFKRGDALSAAQAYHAGFRAANSRVLVEDRFDAARAWATVGRIDSAFSHLNRLAVSGGIEKSRYETAQELAVLRADLRWLTLMDVVSKSSTPLEQHGFRVLDVIPMRARLMTLDESGNAYVVKSDNSLLRYTPEGDSSAFFRSITNGEIGQVDATNPWRILVYYPGQSRITVLDRFLAPITEIDLRAIGITVPTAVATSADGGVWVYDPFNARLRRLDEAGREIQESNDLRQQLSEVPVAHFLIERDRKVYLCDTVRGIFVFDRFASPLITLPIPGRKSIQVAGKQLVYLAGNTLRSYDLNSMTEAVLPLPEAEPTNVRAAALGRGVVWVLRAGALYRYALPEKR